MSSTQVYSLDLTHLHCFNWQISQFYAISSFVRFNAKSNVIPVFEASRFLIRFYFIDCSSRMHTQNTCCCVNISDSVLRGRVDISLSLALISKEPCNSKWRSNQEKNINIYCIPSYSIQYWMIYDFGLSSLLIQNSIEINCIPFWTFSFSVYSIMCNKVACETTERLKAW